MRFRISNTDSSNDLLLSLGIPGRRFFVVAAFIAGGVSTAYHLSHESTSVLLFLFWGPLCVGFGRKLGTPEKPSTLFWIPMEYWGYGLIGLGALSAYVEWDKIASDWLAAV